MKNNQKIQTTKKKTNPKVEEIDPPLMKGDLLLIPVGILSALCTFSALNQLTTAFQHPDPATSYLLIISLLVACFGLLYAYKTFRRNNRSLLTRTMAGIQAVLLLIAFILTLSFTSGGSSCTGFFGAKTDCIDLQYLALYFLLFNPFVGITLGVTSLVGIFSILIKNRK